MFLNSCRRSPRFTRPSASNTRWSSKPRASKARALAKAASCAGMYSGEEPSGIATLLKPSIVRTLSPAFVGATSRISTPGGLPAPFQRSMASKFSRSVPGLTKTPLYLGGGGCSFAARAAAIKGVMPALSFTPGCACSLNRCRMTTWRPPRAATWSGASPLISTESTYAERATSKRIISMQSWSLVRLMMAWWRAHLPRESVKWMYALPSLSPVCTSWRTRTMFPAVTSCSILAPVRGCSNFHRLSCGLVTNRACMSEGSAHSINSTTQCVCLLRAAMISAVQPC
mmetsp:Transcript_51466/g.122401  ORF Transcript_51466/g.122401 Transcript_51466/m.122401 type:complete len:285 (-) Transcript_51466:1272-2126(-)